MIIIKYQVVKSVGGNFWVKKDNHILGVKGRKKLKYDKSYVVDFVDIDENQKVIEKVLSRKNFLIRPPLANVEQALIVVAPLPKPDFLLVDKMLIKFFSLGITPIIVINKIDLCAQFFINDIIEQYGEVCKIVLISALDYNNTATTLNPELSGKFSILTGQSAVGKTSILNVLVPDIEMETGEVSKVGRGRNTTRHSEIFVMHNGALIADTPGFNALELDEFSPEDIIDNYLEFNKFKCKYNNCNHIAENDNYCAVKQAVRDGKINKKRYERFVKLYLTAKEKEKKQYG